MALCDEVLRGAIDLHQHAAPSLFDRITDDIGLASEARQRGMRGVLIKAHEQDTTGRAALARRQVPGVEIYGGLVLNWFSGGSHFGRSMKMKEAPKVSAKGISVLDERGALRGEATEILGLIAEADICLSTGHLSPKEIRVLVPAARRAGIKKILITHPDLGLSGISLDDQKALAAEGAVLEKDLIAMMPAWQSVNLEGMAKSIREIGVEHCVLGTDFGQLHHPTPAEGLRMFVQMLLERGFSPEELRTMVVSNPARLLGLD